MKNRHRPFHPAILMIALIVTLTTACYVPYSIQARFPDGAETILPPQLELDDERLLAIPVWLNPGQSLFFGTPVVLEVSKLDQLGELTSRYRKRGMVDVFGHEGLGVPIFLEVFLISETGVALRARYDHWSYYGPKGWGQHESGWTEVRLANVNEELRARLVDATQAETAEEPWGTLAYDFWQDLATRKFHEARDEPPPPITVDIPWTDEQRAEAKAFLDVMAIQEVSEGDLWELIMDLNPERHEISVPEWTLGTTENTG